MFPNLENYDIKKPGEMALYHLHCELMPFEALITTVEHGLNTYSEHCFKSAKMANEINDIQLHSDLMMMGQVYTSRVIPMANYSIIILLVSILEDGFNIMCRSYQLINKYDVTYKDINGLGIDRTIIYLEKICGVKGIKDDMDWEFITTVRDIRNKIVHSGGFINGKKLKTKVDKFKFGLTERNKVIISNESIREIYSRVMDFTERVFRIEPVVIEERE